MFISNMIRCLFLFLKKGKIFCTVHYKKHATIILKVYWIWIVIFLSSCHFIEPSEPFQEGVWVGETCTLDIRYSQDFLIDLSYRDIYIISQLKIVLQRDFFLDADCTKNKKALEQKAFFNIIKNKKNNNENIQMEFIHEKSEFYSTENTKHLNNLFFCRIEDWENFQKKDANEMNCQGSAPIIYVNQGEKYIVDFYFKNGILLELLSEKREHGRRFIKVQQVERAKESNQP